MPNDNVRTDRRTTVIVDSEPSNETEFGTTVIEAIANELDIAPASLPPLQDSIDMDILNAFPDGSGGAETALSFEYVGYEVVVTSDGAIWLYSLE